MKKQAGFAYIELVLVLAVVAALGAVGWWVYGHNKPKTSQTVSTASQSTQKAADTAPNGTSQNLINAIDKSVSDESSVDSAAASSESTQASTAINSATSVGDSVNAATF